MSESTLKVRTNYHRRDVVYGHELSAREREEFDYLDWSEPNGDGWGRSFVRYRGWVYDLGEFECTNFHGANEEFANWDGYQSDSYFSGVLVRYVSEDNRADTEERWRGGGEFVQMATYCC